jgi:acyl carrier protein
MAGENMTYFEAWRRFAALNGRRGPIKPMSRLAGWIAGSVGDLRDRFAISDSVFNSAAIGQGNTFHYYTSQRADSELGYRSRPADESIRDAWEWFARMGIRIAHGLKSARGQAILHGGMRRSANIARRTIRPAASACLDGDLISESERGIVATMSSAIKDSSLAHLDAVLAATVLEEVRSVARERAKNLTLETKVRALGLDSLEFLDLVGRIEAACNVRIPEVEAVEIQTCRDLVETVSRQQLLRPLYGQELPPEYWQFDQTREYLQLQKSLADAAAAGESDPFFVVCESVSSSTIP